MIATQAIKNCRKRENIFFSKQWYDCAIRTTNEFPVKLFSEDNKVSISVENNDSTMSCFQVLLDVRVRFALRSTLKNAFQLIYRDMR